MERIKSVLTKDMHQTRLFCAFALVLVLMAIIVPDKFFTVRNFQSMATQFPELGFLTIGAALVLILRYRRTFRHCCCPYSGQQRRPRGRHWRCGGGRGRRPAGGPGLRCT